MYRGIPTPPPLPPRSYCTGCDGTGITSEDEYCPKCNYVEPWKHGRLMIVLLLLLMVGGCVFAIYKGVS